MKTLKLNNDKTIPALGLGTWNSEKEKLSAALNAAVETGYRHIDCAAIYGNEQEIGECFTQIFTDGKVKREEMFITSKLWNSKHHPEKVIPALKKTLADLQLDYLDLYLIHWPVAVQPNQGEEPDTFISLDELPIIETWRELEKAHEQGLIKSIGVSNFSVKKLESLLSEATIKPVVNQIEMHPYLAQNELKDFADENRVVLTAYCPLGSRKSTKDDAEKSILQEPVLMQIAKDQDVSVQQILLAWGIERDTVVIPKSDNPEHVRSNYEAAKLTLSSEQIEQINDLDQHHRYVDGSFVCKGDSPYTLENLWDEGYRA